MNLNISSDKSKVWAAPLMRCPSQVDTNNTEALASSMQKSISQCYKNYIISGVNNTYRWYVKALKPTGIAISPFPEQSTSPSSSQWHEGEQIDGVDCP